MLNEIIQKWTTRSSKIGCWVEPPMTSVIHEFLTASDKRTRPGNEATYQKGGHNIQGSIIVPLLSYYHFTIAVARAVITTSYIVT